MRRNVCVCVCVCVRTSTALGMVTRLERPISLRYARSLMWMGFVRQEAMSALAPRPEPGTNNEHADTNS
jgi:hypothetical protein